MKNHLYSIIMLRKINSLLSIPILLLFAAHMLLMSGLLTGNVGFNPEFKKISFLLLALVAVHALFGICFMIERVVKRKRGQKTYASPNAVFILQAATGLAMLILVLLHTSAYGYTTPEGVFVLRDPSVFYFITECLFALSICLHCAVSYPRMAVTFGLIREEKGLKKFYIASGVVFGIFFLIAVTAFSLYYLPALITL